MSKLVKIFASVALIAVMFTATAEARGGHGHGGWHHGGHWRGGGWGPAWGWGYPYAYYPRTYYYADCGWVRVWRHGRWVLRRSWRCY